MFFFSKKSNKYNDFSVIGLDMHSHLIPGVDDGAKDKDDSLALIAGLTSLGFTHFITTPHTLQDIHPNSKETLTAAFDTLKPYLENHIQFDLSSEYFLDDQFTNQLEENSLMPMPGNRILIEFSQISRPQDLEQRVFEIGIKGHQVILAHPERYLFFHKNLDLYTKLKDTGVEFQVNALSLTPYYGKNVNSIAEKLIDMGYIDFIGTDAHHLNHIEALKHVPKSKHFEKLVDSGLLKNNSLKLS